MTASRHEARRSLRNQYFTWHAQPRSLYRSPLPPIRRRSCGSVAAATPPTCWRDYRRTTAGIAAIHPPTHPLVTPDNLSAPVSPFQGSLPTLDPCVSRLLSLRCCPRIIRGVAAHVALLPSNPLSVSLCYANA